MNKSKVSLTVLLALVASYSVSTLAAEWEAGRYNILHADVNADGKQDIYLQAITSTENIQGPYEITFDVTTPPSIDDVILKSAANNTYTVAYPPLATDISSFTLSGNHQAVYGADFNGDDKKDILLQAINANADTVVLLAPNGAAAPAVNQVITGAALGIDLAANNGVVLTPSDTNLDGRSDLLAHTTSPSADRVSLADTNGVLQPLFTGTTACSVAGNIDSDCDNVSDIDDAFPLDPTKTLDTDNDGIADNLDQDIDGDLVLNAADTGTDAEGGAISYAADKFNGSAVGVVEGDFNVSSTGKPTYTIPIKQTPSVANIAPELSLVYSGQSGNDIMGVGWYLDGLSKITRCTTTIARNGFINPINYDSSDRFCLNGEHLVAVSGVYGANNTEYRTENESYSKIISKDVQNCGPVSFEVWRKDGRIEYFGSAANSRRTITRKLTVGSCNGAGDLSVVAEWAIDKVQDRENNQATFTYNNDTTNGTYIYIQKIDFNSNQTKFIYDAANTRTDIAKKYADGYTDELKVRLKNIETYQGGTKVRSYHLGYSAGAATGRSRLANVKECSGVTGNSCLQPTVFTWDAGTEQPVFSADANNTDSTFSIASSYVDQKFQLGDVNGDGLQDIIWTYLTSTNGLGRVVYQANATDNATHGFTKQIAEVESGYYASSIPVENQEYLVGDVNGDGRDDLVWMARNNTELVRVIYLSTGTGFTSQGYEVDSISAYGSATDSKYHLADMNGDGRKDLIWTFISSDKVSWGIYLAYQDTAGKVAFGKATLAQDTATPSLTPSYYQNNSIDVADVDADGRADLVYTFVLQGAFARVLYLANENGTTFKKVSLAYDESLLALPQTMSNHQVQLGDVNADGKSDIVWTFAADNTLGTAVYLADADGLGFTKKDAAFKPVSGLHPLDYQSATARIVDINGDGKADLLYSYQNYSLFGWVSLLASQNGEGFTYSAMATQSVANPSYKNQEYLSGDVTGDGKTDLVWTYTDNVNNVGRISSKLPQSHPDHITEITDGFSAKIKIGYQYMAAANFYTKGPLATYPLRADTGQSYLVNSIQKTNGLGGFNTWTYKYEGATTDNKGRGFLGFAKRIVTDSQTGFITTETYRLEYPFLGQLQSSVVEKSAGNPIQKTYNHWKSTTVSYGSVTTDLRYLDDSVSLTYDLTAVAPSILTKAVVTENTYDYTTGNLTGSVVTTGLGFSGAIDTSFVTTGDFTGSSHVTTMQGVVATLNDYTTSATDIDNWRFGFLESQTTTYTGNTGVDGTIPTTRTVTNTSTPYTASSFLLLSKTEYAGGGNLERTTTYGRDTPYGNPITTTVSAKDHDGSTMSNIVETVSSYEDGMFPVTVTKGGLSTTFTYNKKFGAVEKIVDPRNAVTTTYFDGFGRVASTVLPDGSKKYVDYNNCASGCMLGAKYAIQTTLARNGTAGYGAPPVTTYFDLLQREMRTSTVGFDGTAIIYVDTIYDARGRVDKKSEPYISTGTKFETTFTYDNLNRVTFEARADGGTTGMVFSFDATYGTKQTKTVTLKKPDNSTVPIVTVIKSNTLGKMIESTDGNTVPTKFAYDAQGNLRWTQVNSQSDTTISVTSDLAGNRTQLVDPDAGTINSAFDALGRMRVQTQSPGGAYQQTTTVVYDDLNRMLSRADTSGGATETSTWAYYTTGTGNGLLYLVTATDYQKTISYDSLGRLANESITIKGDEKQFGYSYDGFSRLATKTYPSGFEIATRYNAQGYKSAITNVSTGAAYWQANTADARGNVTNETYGSGVITQRSFNPANGVIATIKTGPSGSASKFQDWAYQFDSEGNLYQRKSARILSGSAENLTEDFTYDNLYRVVQAASTGNINRTLTYGYNPLGNMTSRSDIGTLAYDKTTGGGVHAVSAANGVSYQYDTKGNMKQNGTRTLTYTVDNNPSSITDTADTITFQYGADRQRIYQNHANTNTGRTTVTKYYEGEFEVVSENGEKVREKTYIGGFMVLTKVYKLGSAASSGDLSYLHKDHLGSTDAITTQAAADEGRMLFDPFGKRRQDNGTDEDATYKATLADKTFSTTTKGYTGHEQLDSVGLIHMGGRVYDPYIGRFLSPDEHVQYPEFTQSYNRYSYVLNNPLSYTDPTGEESKSLPNGNILHVDGDSHWETTKDNVLVIKSSAGASNSGAMPPKNADVPDAKTATAQPDYANPLGTAEMAEARKKAFRDSGKIAVSIVGAIILSTEKKTAELTETAVGTVAELASAARAAKAAEKSAEAARDALAQSYKKYKPATVTGGHNVKTGEVSAQACGGGKCAEDHVVDALGGNKADIKFTKAIRPRTEVEVPICANCEKTYGRDAFPPDTKFKTDE